MPEENPISNTMIVAIVLLLIILILELFLVFTAKGTTDQNVTSTQMIPQKEASINQSF